MSAWYPDVTTVKGVRSALNGGVAASLARAGLGVIAMITVYRVVPPAGMESWDTMRARYMAISGAEVLLNLVVAYRFFTHRGLILGSVAVLAMFSEIGLKIYRGWWAWRWPILYAFILLGWVNGLRAAWVLRHKARVMRAAQRIEDTDLDQVFD